jgi:hypothetical protein
MGHRIVKMVLIYSKVLIPARKLISSILREIYLHCLYNEDVFFAFGSRMVVVLRLVCILHGVYVTVYMYICMF